MTLHSTPPRRRRAAVGLLAGTGLAASALFAPSAGAAPKPRISISYLSTYATGVFDASAAEIVAHDPSTQQLFVVNAQQGAIDVLDIRKPNAPTLVGTLLSASGGRINSVAVMDGIVAVAVQNPDVAQDLGTVEFYSTRSLAFEDSEVAEKVDPLSEVKVGALPDMLTFTPDGTKVVVANEGEPAYCDPIWGDPEGSISIIDLSNGVENAVVETADFKEFDDQESKLRADGVRIFGPNATVAQDLEPEYVTIDADSTTAWVSLQENNAFAVVDLESATVTDILPLGFKDHSLPGNGFDASNRDEKINIQNWPVKGMYMPDAIDSYEFGGRTYIVSANEGDARDYPGCYSEERRIGGLALDPKVFRNAKDLQKAANLGRLNSTVSFDTVGFDEVGGEFFPVTEPATELYAYGARSFSIWSADGELVFDSGDDFEQITARMFPDDFNSNNDENGSFDSRSDDKGPEPEGVVVAELYSKTYAFIGLERVGGIMVYDITTPNNPKFVQYLNNRNFDGETPTENDPDTDEDETVTESTALDLGPEGLTVITPEDSPTGVALLVVGNEVSGTTTIFEISGPGKAR